MNRRLAPVVAVIVSVAGCGGNATPTSPPTTAYGIMLYVEPHPPCAGPGGSAPLGFTLINVAVTSSRLTAVAGRTSCNGVSLGTVNLSKQ